MKAYVVSYNRPETITTPSVLEPLGVDVTVIVHNADQAAAYVRAKKLPPNTELVISNQKTGIGGKTRQCRYAANIATPEDWYIGCDDDIDAIYAHPLCFTEYEDIIDSPEIDDEHFLNINKKRMQLERSLFKTPITSSKDLDSLFKKQIFHANKIGANIIGGSGFGSPSPLFQRYRWSHCSFLVGTLVIQKNIPFNWDPSITLDDYRNTAEHLLQYGRVLKDRWLGFKTQYYAKGGIGSYESRIPALQYDVHRLCFQYKGLFAPRQRPGLAVNTDLRIVLNTTHQIDEWRSQMLAEGARGAKT